MESLLLYDYMQTVQRFIHDSKMELVDDGDIIEYINRARREVAQRAQCVRRLVPISGSISSISISMVGSGYTSPTVVISPPDFPSGLPTNPSGLQATATATTGGGGSISTVSVTNSGAGYFQPVASISDPTGSGAVLTPVLSFINQTVQGQEVYPFSGINLAMFPGVASIYSVRSVSIIYANYRYSLPIYSFSVYQAKIRQYPFQYQWAPTIGSQYGRGVDGSFYLYPIASQPYQQEWDSFCTPSDLTQDSDTEVIPQPWTDTVPFLAAYYCFLELQNLNAANFYQKQFDEWVTRKSQHALPGRQTNPYGRW